MRLRTSLLLSSLLLIIGLTIGWFGHVWYNFLTTPLVPKGQTLNYTLRAGTSVKQFANELADRGYLRHPAYLVWFVRLQAKSRLLKPGAYRFSEGTTPGQLLGQIIAGAVVPQYFTLVEGWNFKQMMAAIKQQAGLKHTLKSVDQASVMAAIGYSDKIAEGNFFPDSYRYADGMTDVSLLKRAYDAMQKSLAEHWPQRQVGLPYHSSQQALIVASMIEKETALANERVLIAGVLVRRLLEGMRLQIDATVIYGLGDSYTGKLNKKNMRTDTPYNTYTRKGLPPTAIAMPGIASIKAALHPRVGTALYFVARGDGSHTFSATLDQQRDAIDRYQLNKKHKKPAKLKQNSTHKTVNHRGKKTD